MRKKEKQTLRDAEFLRERVNDAPQAPDALDSQEIVKLVSGQKQKKNGRAIVRRAAALAAALAVVIGSTVAADKIIYRPAVPETAAQTLPSFDDYAGVIGMIKDYRTSEKYIEKIRLYGRKSYTADEAEVMEIAPAAAEGDLGVMNGASSYSYADTAAASSEIGVSRLNTRDANVDEADIVRTDGKNIYVVSSDCGGVLICRVNADGTTQVASRILTEDIEKKYFGENERMWLSELFITGDKILLCAGINTIKEYSGPYREYDSYYYGAAEPDDIRSAVIVCDVSDAAAPVIEKAYIQDGNYVSARITDGKLLLLSAFAVPRAEDYTVENCVPAVCEDNGERKAVAPDNILIADSAHPDAYNVITTVFLDGSRASDTKAVMGSGWDVYCTADRLFIYACEWDEKTDTEKMTVRGFDITDSGIAYAGCCSFEGHFYNSFSMDWYGGCLRVAATTRAANNLYVFDSGFNEVGSLKGFGENEQIYGIRFLGNTAYVVTFRQIDPLFVIDLTDPAAPKVTGELKMPGFSDYLHPVGDGLLLGIGQGGDENGTDGSAKATLYDVSDPAAPAELSSVIIPNAYFSTEYKAFTAVPGEKAWIVPYYHWGGTAEDNGGAYEWKRTNVTGAVRLDLGADGKSLVKAASYDVIFPDGTLWLNTDRAVIAAGKVHCVDINNGIYSFAPGGEKLGECSFEEYVIPWEPENYNYIVNDNIAIETDPVGEMTGIEIVEAVSGGGEDETVTVIEAVSGAEAPEPVLPAAEGETTPAYDPGAGVSSP